MSTATASRTQQRLAAEGTGTPFVWLHASCVQLAGTGILLLGPSGSGKSDIALSLIDAGATLVADDQVRVECCEGRLFAGPAQALAGLLEVRGMGILRLPCCARTPLGLAVELDAIGPWPRLPEPTTYEVLGVGLRHVRLDPRAPSACAKIRVALAAERVA